jgi:hypothetical protein
MTAINGVSPACYLRFMNWIGGVSVLILFALFPYYGQTFYNVTFTQPALELNQNTLGQKNPPNFSPWNLIATNN